MKNISSKDLESKAKGTIAIGAVAYGTIKIKDKLVFNPAIPLIPRIGIGVMLVLGASIVLNYGFEELAASKEDNHIGEDKLKNLSGSHDKDYEVLKVFNKIHEGENKGTN